MLLYNPSTQVYCQFRVYTNAGISLALFIKYKELLNVRNWWESFAVIQSPEIILYNVS